MSAAWLLAPLTAGSLALGADWALQNDPLAAASTGTHSVQPTVSSGLQQRAELAARRLRRSEAGLVRLEAAEQQRSDQLNLLKTEVQAIREARRTGRAVRLPSSDTAAAPSAAPTAPSPLAVPSAPSVSTTTGAS